jgi:hypothetical protein
MSFVNVGLEKMGLVMDTDFYFETPITYTLKQIIIWLEKYWQQRRNLPELRVNSFLSSFTNVWRTPIFHSYVYFFKIPIKGVNLCEFLYSIQANLERK